jgi:hypothetical protein
MNLTPASLKTLRRKGFKETKKYLSQSSSPLCVFASLRETSAALAPPRQKSNFLSVVLTPASLKTLRIQRREINSLPLSFAPDGRVRQRMVSDIVNPFRMMGQNTK